MDEKTSQVPSRAMLDPNLKGELSTETTFQFVNKAPVSERLMPELAEDAFRSTSESLRLLAQGWESSNAAHRFLTSAADQIERAHRNDKHVEETIQKYFACPSCGGTVGVWHGRFVCQECTYPAVARSVPEQSIPVVGGDDA